MVLKGIEVGYFIEKSGFELRDCNEVVVLRCGGVRIEVWI